MDLIWDTDLYQSTKDRLWDRVDWAPPERIISN